jgi:glyoxylase-like metal-dependent hydrolase (beta-lactamase superfamily II)
VPISHRDAAPRIPIRVLAPNPGPFTLDGTNTWIVGSGPSVVIDPGPALEEHVDAVWGEAEPIAAIIMTHRHSDHSAAAQPLGARSGAPLLAFRPVRGERRIRDGDVFLGGGARLRAMHTPGHTPDHVAFHDPDTGALFTGDAVLGRGTSVISPPEGDMAAYLRSLAAMRRLAPRVIYPGHGPAVWAARSKLDEYLEHRAERERQILGALGQGPRTPADLVPAIYADHPEEVHAAAAASVLAHLIKLEREGAVGRVGPPAENRFRLASVASCGRCGRPALPRSTLCVNCSLAALQEDPGPSS